MATPKPVFEKILYWEGGYGNDKVDGAGATKFGITLAALLGSPESDKDGDGDTDADDVKLLTKEDAYKIFIEKFWKRWKADSIKNQSVAAFLVDWLYNSGGYGIILPQEVLGVKTDGRVGTLTIDAVNKANQQDLFIRLKRSRLHFIDGIVANSVAKLYYDLKIFNTSGQLPEKGGDIVELLSHKYTGIDFVISNDDLLTYTKKRFELGWKRRINSYTFTP